MRLPAVWSFYHICVLHLICLIILLPFFAARRKSKHRLQLVYPISNPLRKPSSPSSYPSLAASTPETQANSAINPTMETLLSVAFDNLSSYDGPKVKKGLRQVEGLLAQICLSAHAANRNKNNNNNNPKSPNSRATSPSDGPKHQQQPDKPASATRFPLSDLSGDAAFREFFKLQDGFQWNIATRLIQTLDRLLAKSDDGSMDLLMLSALDSLQGTLLLHPPSRLLFSREQSMNVST